MSNLQTRIEALSVTQRQQLAARLQEQNMGEQAKQLVAYMVPALDQPEPSSEVLRQFLKKRLPSYMIPARFVSLDAMPLTPNGKVDRQALPDPNDVWAEFDDDFVAPQNETEEALVKIWADVLSQDTDMISIHDNFFEIGGDSLLATQVISRLPDTFQVRLPIQRLFEAPTVSELATAIDETAPEPAEDAAPQIMAVSRQAYRRAR